MTIDVNAHPPASVFLLLPFGFMGYHEAHTTWNVVSLIFLAISLWLIMRPKGLEFSTWAIVPFLTFLLTSNSLAQQINQGQFNLALLLLITGAWAAERAGKSWLAGVLIGVAASIKVFPAFLLLYYVVRREWIAILAAGWCIVVLNLLSGTVLGFECYETYVFEIIPKVGSEYRDFWPNASIAGFWSKLFDARSGHVVPLWQSAVLAKSLTGLCAAAVIVSTAWKCWNAKSCPQRDLAFSLCIVAMLLVSPITWDHYFLLLLLPLAAYWRIASPNFAARTVLLGTAITLVTISPKWIWDVTIPGPGELVLDPNLTPSVASPLHTVTVISYQFYSLLGLFVFAIWARPEGERSTFHQSRVESVENAPA